MDPIANLISEEDMDRIGDQFTASVQRLQAWLTQKARKLGSDREVLAKAINGTTTRDRLLPELVPMNNSTLNQAKPVHLPSKPDIMRKYLVRTQCMHGGDCEFFFVVYNMLASKQAIKYILMPTSVGNCRLGCAYGTTSSMCA